MSGAPELSAAPESASTGSPLPQGDLEVTMGSDALCDQEDTPGTLSAGGGMPRCPEDCRRVKRGRAQFTDVCLGPPPPGYHPIPFLDSKHEKASNRPRGSLGPGRTTPTVRDPPAGSRGVCHHDPRRDQPSVPGPRAAHRLQTPSGLFKGDGTAAPHPR
ncbi:MORN repeat containing 1 [Rhinolophus ferrumequinum]|uniref:MORN repeat containing 1 n=1 Tax=Rhinolophus ferrumequinum TaxID=59479 RepID=A0A7J7X6D1_RHIFE|nr:MORN repeat containing 1 [Rhinolophus ferrumequinum]